MVGSRGGGGGVKGLGGQEGGRGQGCRGGEV